MNDGPLAALSAEAALDQVAFSWDANRIARNCGGCDSLFFRLVEAKLAADALQLLPRIIPIRRAIWFACLGAWYGADGKLPPAEDHALRSAVLWTIEPWHDRQVEAGKAVAPIGWKSPAGRCAAAVERAGCTWADSDQWAAANIPFAARLCAHAVLAAVERSPEGKDVATTRLLALGVQIAMGRHLWNQ